MMMKSFRKEIALLIAICLITAGYLGTSTAMAETAATVNSAKYNAVGEEQPIFLQAKPDSQTEKNTVQANSGAFVFEGHAMISPSNNAAGFWTTCWANQTCQIMTAQADFQRRDPVGTSYTTVSSTPTRYSYGTTSTESVRKIYSISTGIYRTKGVAGYTCLGVWPTSAQRIGYSAPWQWN